MGRRFSVTAYTMLLEQKCTRTAAPLHSVLPAGNFCLPVENNANKMTLPIPLSSFIVNNHYISTLFYLGTFFASLTRRTRNMEGIWGLQQ